MVTALLDATKGSAQGRLIASLEGGYHSEGVADGVESVIRAMLQWEGECGIPPPPAAAAAAADHGDHHSQDTSTGPSSTGSVPLSFTTMATSANHGAAPDTVDAVARVRQRLAPYWKCFSQAGPAAKLA
jgi:hypothetical protein